MTQNESLPKKILTRRGFLKNLSIAASGAAVASMLRPRLAFAQSTGGASPVEIYIRIFLSGGADGLWIAPPKDPTLFAALKAVRPTILGGSVLNNASQVLDLGHSFGLNPVFGTSSSMAANGLRGIHQLALQGDFKLLPKIGFPTPNLDHTAATDPWNIGRLSFDRSSALYWESRLMEQGLEWNQLWALGQPSGNVPLRAPSGYPNPISARQLSMVSKVRFDDWQYGWHQGSELGGAPEVEAAKQAISQILALPDAADVPVALREYKRGMRDALGAVDEFVPINSIVLPAYFPQYTFPYAIDENFRDIAKVVTRYRVQAPSSHRKLLFQLGYMGFDSHENQTTGIHPLLEGLNHCIGALQRYLSEQGLWDKTVIQICGEFGRDIHENGKFGTGHGHGSMHFLVGGAVDSSRGLVAGGSAALPTLADITNPARAGDSRILQAALDPRSVYWELLEGLGFDPSAVLPEPDFTRTSVGLI